MKNKFKRTIIGALLLALTTVYGGMLPVSATDDTSSTTVSVAEDDKYYYNGHAYKLFDTSMDWNSAQQYCQG